MRGEIAMCGLLKQQAGGISFAAVPHTNSVRPPQKLSAPYWAKLHFSCNFTG